MTSYRAIVEAASRWIDRVAATILAGRESFRTRPHFQLAEQQDGSFALREPSQGEILDEPRQPILIAGGRVDPAVAEKLADSLRGAHVELLLQPNRFIFRPLELPRRALDFIDGIVRSQIDRLTPWSPAEAAFGWHPSIDTANDRIEVTIAATARVLIAPFLSAITALGAETVIVSAALPQPAPDIAAIKICEQKTGQTAGLARIRRILIGLIAGGGALASVSLAVNAIAGGALETQRDDLARRIEERRAVLRHGQGGTSEAVRSLEQHKRETSSSVIVIEALSRVLPDDTYLTELRILGDKVQIVGVTKSAPALIRLIEQTSHFSRATFFAPTTRSLTEQREHFHIEAHIEPVYTPGL
ncbi:MAG TPA: PilN domain-containing protein [Methylocella sp.]|nr:PilN domain-containing protein [Methylocella sp.]